MEDESLIKTILSGIFIVFNVCIFIVSLIIIKATKKLNYPLKRKFLILIIIDTFSYIFFLYSFTNIFNDLIYEFFCSLLYSIQIYLFISLGYKIIIFIKPKNKYLSNLLSPLYISLIWYFLLFSYDKIFDLKTEVFITIKSIIFIPIILFFYKYFYNCVGKIENIIHKKYLTKLKVIKNIKIILNISFWLLIIKCFINIILNLIISEEYKEFLKMPLDLIIYMKYFDFTIFIAILINCDDKHYIKKIGEETNIIKEIKY